MGKEKIKKTVGNVFLAVPMVLLMLNLVLVIWYQGGNYEIRLEIWKQWRTIAYRFYLISFLGLLGWFLVDLFDEKHLSFWSLFIKWFLGGVSVWFTFAISGFIVDVIYLVLLALRIL